MKESKTRDTLTPRKRKHGKGTSTGLESWDQTDLEDADEKVLEKRLHQLKMQLEMDQDGEREKRLPNKYRKKYSEEPPTSDTDSSDSESTLSSNSSGSVHRYKSKRSSSVSDDDRRKRYSRSPVTKKKYLKNLKNSKSGSRVDKDGTLSSKADKRIVFRKKTSPSSDKYSRKKSPKSPLLDRREIYSRVDTGRWHEKAKEFTKERNKRDIEPDKTRSRSRAERNRSISLAREPPKVSARTKEDRVPKRNASRGSNANVAARRKDSPEQSRARISHDAARRNTTTNRKLSPRSPKDERAGRHDERRLDVKVTRRTDTRGDSRDVSLRITRDVRDRKEPNLKLPEKSRDREVVGKAHRDVIELNSVDRDRNRVNDDRFKDRDKRLPDRLEPDRNPRALTHNSRDSATDDKFRRNDRTIEVNRGGGVFDRMRNRYNDRRNAENNQRLNRERERIPEKEPIKPRLVDVNGADKAIRDRSRPLVPQVRIRSPLHRDRKELPEKTTITEKRSRSPVDFEKRFPNPLNSRKARELENRIPVKRKSQENDDPQWNKKKTPNEIRSRSRSSERRRRKSSQEEWRVIDMTSPVLDDEFSDDNIGTFDSNTNRSRRAIANKLLLVGKTDEHYDSDPSKHKSILTDELSDISDEDFGDINPSNNCIRTKKDLLSRNERFSKSDQLNRTYDQKSLNDCNNVGEKMNTVETNVSPNYVEDLIIERKLSTQADNERVDFEKATDDLDSEEETVSRVSDALGVDWTDLVEESKRRAPSCSLDASYSIRRRWKAINILTRIGVSEKYAGEELYNEIESNIMAYREKDDLAGESRAQDDSEKLWHKIPGLHTCLKDKALKRRNLFEPHKTAISARKDIMLRRRLCGLPVKNLRTQQIIGVTHWLV